MSSRRIKKWLIGLGATALLLTVAIVVAWFTVVPPVLEGQILKSLHRLGLTQASITIRKLTFSTATLEDFRIDPEFGFQVKEIEVHYSLTSLRNASVDNIVLSGIETVSFLPTRSMLSRETVRSPETL